MWQKYMYELQKQCLRKFNMINLKFCTRKINICQFYGSVTFYDTHGYFGEFECYNIIEYFKVKFDHIDQ
jgi:hypothetical protein